MHRQSVSSVFRTARFHPCLEPLEARWCPSFSLGVVNGPILQALSDGGPGQVDFVDDGAGNITATADGGTPQSFRGVKQVVVRGGNNSDDISYALSPAATSGFLDGGVRPADLLVDLGGGNNSFVLNDHFLPPSYPWWYRPWNINVMSGRGDTQVTTQFDNANSDVNLHVQFGNGVNGFTATLFYPDHQNQGSGGPMSGMNIDVHGGSGRNSFNVTAEGYTGTTFLGHGVQLAPLHVQLYGTGVYDGAIIAIFNLDLRAASQFNFQGGAGKDDVTFTARDVNGYAPLDFVANGGLGNDRFQIQCAAPTPGDSSGAPGPCNIYNTWTGNVNGGGGDDSLIGLLFPAVQDGGAMLWHWDTGAGNDEAMTTMIPAVQSGGFFFSSLQLGAGNDTWSGLVAPTVAMEGMASFEVVGGGGRDSYAPTFRPAVETDAVCNLHLDTGDGSSQVAGLIDPSINRGGVCNIVFQGGRGNDTFNVLVNLPGLSAGCNLNVLMAGGAGNDHLTMLAQGQADPLATVSLQVDGGPGFDIATVAAIVNVINCEQKIVG